MRRLLIAMATLAVVAVLAHGAFRAAVAYAIATAPNGGGLGAKARPASVASGGDALVVEVGPPQARLAAWILEPSETPATRRTVVLLHGLRLDHDSMRPLARRFARAGYRAVLVDLRGHGQSSGSRLTYGETESHDIAQLIDALEQRDGASPIDLFGYSYGGAVALHLAARDARVSAVVAVASFCSLRRVVTDYEHRYFPALEPWVPAGWLEDAVEDAADSAHFDPDDSPLRAAARINAELLIVHGLADTQVPPEHARALRMAAGSGASLMLLDGETHDSVLRDEAGTITKAALELFARQPRTAAGLASRESGG